MLDFDCRFDIVATPYMFVNSKCSPNYHIVIPSWSLTIFLGHQLDHLICL